MTRRTAESSRGWRLTIGAGAIALLGLSLVLTARPASTRSNDATDHGVASPVERFTASAVSRSAIGQAITNTLEITIDRWSTDAERDRLATTLKTRGPDALLTELRALPRIGIISTPRTVGWSLHFARTQQLGDGRRQVTIATDRPLSPDEQSTRRRSVEYPFSLLDIRFDVDGVGVGKLAYASNVAYNTRTGTIEIEKFGTEPVRLTNVRSTGAHE